MTDFSIGVIIGGIAVCVVIMIAIPFSCYIAIKIFEKFDK